MIPVAYDFDSQPNNLFGAHGPLCPACSGLGRVLRLGSVGAPTRYASKCVCGGTGVDRELVREREHQSLIARLNALELQFARDLQARQPKSKRLKTIKNSRQYWMELIAWATASGTAVASSVTETILFPNITIPANYMQDGRNLRLYANGQHSTLGSGTVTVLFTLRWGGVSGTIITKSAAITQLISLTAALWEIDIKLSTRSNGATGTIMSSGQAAVYGATAPTIGSATGAPAIAPMTNGGQVTPAVATLDLTADTALSLTITHGANSSSNTATGLQYVLESMN